MESGIYVVATPIGNLGDISLRAIEVLKAVDYIAAEDTRHTKRLLDHLDIRAKLISLHDHNEKQKAQEVIDLIAQGGAIALVSDAGTPLISDPGHVLVSLAREQGVRLVPVPGASALIAGLSVAGISAAKFIFEGFLPAKEKAKRECLEALAYESRSIVFYESPHRILATLTLMDEMYPERILVVARELTKQFETIKKAKASELLVWMEQDANQKRGEFVLLMEGYKGAERAAADIDQDKLLKRLAEELPPKKAAGIMADFFGGSKKEFYELVLKLKK